jgi:hypothetical protein
MVYILFNARTCLGEDCDYAEVPLLGADSPVTKMAFLCNRSLCTLSGSTTIQPQSPCK